MPPSEVSDGLSLDEVPSRSQITARTVASQKTSFAVPPSCGLSLGKRLVPSEHFRHRLWSHRSTCFQTLKEELAQLGFPG